MANKLFFGASLFILGLAVGLLNVNSDSALTHSAMAQGFRPATAGGIMAFTGQIDKDIYGIMMVDVDAGTLWVYQYRKAGNLKLLAARSWLYDRYLEEYNTDKPTPSEVAQLVASQQQKVQQNATATAPAEDETAE